MADALKNNTNGPRAINTTKGAVILAPGETLGDEHEVSDADRAAIESTGFLTANPGSGVEPANPSSVAATLNAMGTGTAGPPDAQTAEQLEKANNKDQLLEIAQTEGVDVPEGANKADIAAAIVDKRNA